MKIDNKKDVIALLRNILLFSSLTAEEIHKISGKLVVRKFKKNETILYEEDTNEFMYVILSGKVKVTQTTEDGREVILAIHRTGDFFGEVSLLDGKTAPAMVLAMENSIIALISRKDFYTLIHSQDKVLNVLLQILCSRLRESWGKIQMLSFNNAAQRVKMLFLSLSNEYGKLTDDGVILNIKLTHQDMANMAGVTRETVTRVLDKWQKEGDISILKNKQICLSHGFFTVAL